MVFPRGPSDFPRSLAYLDGDLLPLRVFLRGSIRGRRLALLQRGPGKFRLRPPRGLYQHLEPHAIDHILPSVHPRLRGPYAAVILARERSVTRHPLHDLGWELST